MPRPGLQFYTLGIIYSRHLTTRPDCIAWTGPGVHKGFNILVCITALFRAKHLPNDPDSSEPYLRALALARRRETVLSEIESTHPPTHPPTILKDEGWSEILSLTTCTTCALLKDDRRQFRIPRHFIVSYIRVVKVNGCNYSTHGMFLWIGPA